MSSTKQTYASTVKGGSSGTKPQSRNSLSNNRRQRRDSDNEPPKEPEVPIRIIKRTKPLKRSDDGKLRKSSELKSSDQGTNLTDVNGSVPPGLFPVEEWDKMTTEGRVHCWKQQNLAQKIALWKPMRSKKPQACFQLWEKLPLDEKKIFWPELVKDAWAADFWWFIPLIDQYEFFRSLPTTNDRISTWLKLGDDHRGFLVESMKDYELLQLWYDLKEYAPLQLLPHVNIIKARTIWKSIQASHEHIWSMLKDSPYDLAEFSIELGPNDSAMVKYCANYEQLPYNLVFGV
jgi:hypothetical protein